MQDQNETTWMHYQEDVSVPVSKNYFYKKKETQLVVNYHCGVYSDRDIKMCHCSFSAIFINQFQWVKRIDKSLKQFFSVGEFHINETFRIRGLITTKNIFSTLFGQIWFKKIRIVCLRWNLAPTLIQICCIRW